MGNDIATTSDKKLSTRIATKYGVEPKQLWGTLKATAFRKENVTNEQMMALLVVADQYNLNPFLKELYAFPEKGGGIVPVVGVDGWARIINEHPQFDGMEFRYDSDEQSVTCTMYRKDRSHPTSVTEYLDEMKRSTDTWEKYPKRMLRHKAMIQCARVAFGFAGIKDPDEAERIIESFDDHSEEMGPSLEEQIRKLSEALGAEEQKACEYRLKTVKTPEAMRAYRDALLAKVESVEQEDVVDAEYEDEIY